MIKPSDIFIGLRDVFGFLIPGVIFCVVMLLFRPELQALANQASKAGLGTVGLIGIGYVFGHVFNAAGAMALDPLYEAVQPLLTGTKRFRNIEKFGLATDPARANILCHGGQAPELDASFSRVSFWVDYLRLTSPVAATEIDRVDSIEKFLRSLCVAALLAAVLMALPIMDQSQLLVAIYAVIAAVILFGLFVKFRLERCYRVLKLALLTSQIAAEK
jgi:hypothetical protein